MHEYLKSIQHVLPQIEDLSDKWWMQDGATCHTTQMVLGYLRAPERFGDRIISRHTRIPWPACSPDLNPLDYSFWGQCERQIALKKPKGRDEIIRVVNEYAASLSEELIRSMTNNIIKRARLCVDQNGGHFEHLLNKNEE